MPPRKRSASTKPSAVVPPLNLSSLASNVAHPTPASTERGAVTPLFTLLSTLYELAFLGLILLTVSRQTAGSAGYGGVPYTLLVSGLLSTLVFLCGLLGGSGQGNKGSFQQFLFSRYTGCGRLRNWVCRPCDRARGRYPLANTCQVPFFTSLSDVYTFVFGYKAGGLFVEVGAYDGESFSNTSGLADMGWRGHYLEPIPQYAQAARARHAGNAPRVVVHTVCAGEVDGEAVELSAAGPFSSAVDDEISSVSGSALNATLDTFGWGHNKDSEKIKTTTKSLNTFFKEQGIAPGAVDVMVSVCVCVRPLFFYAYKHQQARSHAHTHTHTYSPLNTGGGHGGL